MSTLILGTNAVSPDEACFSLKEIIEQAPDSRGMRRYQILKVIRFGDKLTECRVDLGPAKSFKSEEFFVPGGVRDERTGRLYVEHTVGELREIADYVRSDQYQRPEPPKGTDLIKGYYDAPDKRRRKRRKQSTFGYGGHTQRSS